MSLKVFLYEPISQPEDGHEVVVVLLGGDEVRNADADVVDESGSEQGLPP